jgi:hypothetical protein
MMKKLTLILILSVIFSLLATSQLCAEKAGHSPGSVLGVWVVDDLSEGYTHIPFTFGHDAVIAYTYNFIADIPYGYCRIIITSYAYIPDIRERTRCLFSLNEILYSS